MRPGGRALSRPQGGLTALGKVAIAVVCAAVFLTAIDQTVVVTALTSMSQDLAVPITEPNRLAWIVSGYLLGYVVAMPLMGRVADVYGRWRVFASCLVLFMVGSLFSFLSPQLGSPISPDTTTLGGALLAPLYSGIAWLMSFLAHFNVDTTSPGLDVLIGARFLQAVGGGALVPLAMALVGDLFGGQRRGLALGLVGAVTEAGGVLGPLWGAWLTTHFGWQAIFSINLPVAAALLVAGYFCIPRQRGPREPIDLAWGSSLRSIAYQPDGGTGTADRRSRHILAGGSRHRQPRLAWGSAAVVRALPGGGIAPALAHDRAGYVSTCSLRRGRAAEFSDRCGPHCCHGRDSALHGHSAQLFGN